MKSVTDLTDQLKRQITAFVVPIQTTGVIDEDQFDNLKRTANKLAEGLTGSKQLPRDVLNELYVTIQILRREDEHRQGNRLLQMADSLEMTFSLILKGEDYSDRKPGIPRIL